MKKECREFAYMETIWYFCNKNILCHGSKTEI